MGTTIRTVEDVEDLAYGLGFLGTGGGGALAHCIDLLSAEVRSGREVPLTPIEEIPPDSWTVTACRLGWPHNPASVSPEFVAADLAPFGLVEPDIHGDDTAQARVNKQVAAVRTLEKFAGVKVAGIVHLELGAGVVSASTVTAMRLGIHAIDGDYTGRAIPELANMKVEICAKSCAPVCFVDRWDNTVIATKLVGGGMGDRVGRMLAVASFGRIGFAAYLMRASDAKDAMVRGSVTYSLGVGRALRQGQKMGKPVEKLLEHTNGWLLFKGTLVREEWERQGAHAYGTHHLEGIEEFTGHVMRIWYKNENHVAWLDDRPIVTSPDYIATVQRDSGVPVTQDEITEGQTLAVLGMKPLDAIYRTPRGLAAFSARHFGLDIDYVPIETMLGPAEASWRGTIVKARS